MIFHYVQKTLSNNPPKPSYLKRKFHSEHVTSETVRFSISIKKYLWYFRALVFQSVRPEPLSPLGQLVRHRCFGQFPSTLSTYHLRDQEEARSTVSQCRSGNSFYFALRILIFSTLHPLFVNLIKLILTRAMSQAMGHKNLSLFLKGLKKL